MAGAFNDIAQITFLWLTCPTATWTLPDAHISRSMPLKDVQISRDQPLDDVHISRDMPSKKVNIRR